MSVIFSLISTLYLKQQINILWRFFSLKFENSLLSNKLLRCIFRSEGRFIQLKMTSRKYFLQNFAAIAINFFNFVKSFKGVLHHSGNYMFYIFIRLWTTTTSDRIRTINIRKQKPYKNFNGLCGCNLSMKII